MTKSMLFQSNVVHIFVYNRCYCDVYNNFFQDRVRNVLVHGSYSALKNP